MKEYSHVMDTLTEARTKDVELGGKSIHEIDELMNKATYQDFKPLKVKLLNKLWKEFLKIQKLFKFYKIQ